MPDTDGQGRRGRRDRWARAVRSGTSPWGSGGRWAAAWVGGGVWLDVGDVGGGYVGVVVPPPEAPPVDPSPGGVPPPSSTPGDGGAVRPTGAVRARRRCRRERGRGPGGGGEARAAHIDHLGGYPPSHDGERERERPRPPLHRRGRGSPSGLVPGHDAAAPGDTAAAAMAPAPTAAAAAPAAPPPSHWPPPLRPGARGSVRLRSPPRRAGSPGARPQPLRPHLRPPHSHLARSSRSRSADGSLRTRATHSGCFEPACRGQRVRW